MARAYTVRASHAAAKTSDVVPTPMISMTIDVANTATGATTKSSEFCVPRAGASMLVGNEAVDEVSEQRRHRARRQAEQRRADQQHLIGP